MTQAPDLPGWAAIFVAILVLAMLPYLSLQLQAIAFALETATTSRGSAPDGLGMLVPVWALLVAGFALLFGIQTGRIVYFETALIIALLGFVGTVALAKFLMRGEVIE